MKNTKLLLIGSLLLAICIGATFIPVVQDQLFIAIGHRYLQKRFVTEKLFQDDALRVLMCGSSGPMADRDRAKACVIVIAGGRYYVVDVGQESTENVGSWVFPMQRIGAVFITHMHSDHIGELGEWNLETWVHGRDAPLNVYGPTGIERVVDGFSEAYAYDISYRSAHHGSKFLPPEAARMVAHPIAMPGPETANKDRTVEAFKLGDLKVTAIEMDHHEVSPAYGYRFDYKGRSVVISGDTAYHLPLAKAAKGADVLLHEANAAHLFMLLREAGKDMPGVERINQINLDLNNYHTTPVDAAKIANAAGVHELVLYHIMPPILTRLQIPMWMRGVADIRSEGVHLAHDGMLIEMPLHSNAINFKDIE